MSGKKPSTPSSATPPKQFNVNLINNGNKEPKTLVASGDTLKLMTGSNQDWAKAAQTVFSIAPCDAEGKTFTITSLHTHKFETDDPQLVSKLKQILSSQVTTTSLTQALKETGATQSSLIRPIVSSSQATTPPGSSSVASLAQADPKKKGQGGLRARADEDPKKSGGPATIDDFELLHVIGKGSFGKVFQVKKKTDGRIYALKVLKKADLFQKKQIEHTLTEKKILAQVQHAFMPRLHYSFQTESKLYMVMDFANGGEIFYHLRRAGRFPEVLAVFYAAEVVSVIDHLHKHNIIYRDLKPENVLLDSEGHLKITDFGLSKIGITSVGGESSGISTSTFCGTPEYLAPEILQNIPHGKAVDWWSAGILFFEMLTGMPPFYSQNRNDMYQNIMKAQLVIPDLVSADARDFIKRILARRPEDRLGSGAGEGAEVKNHPLFKNIDWTALEKRTIPPPFKPKFKDGIMDISNIDKQFLDMPLVDSPVPPMDPSYATQVNKQFVGFDFSKEDDTGASPALPIAGPSSANINTIPVTRVEKGTASDHPLLQNNPPPSPSGKSGRGK